MLKILVLGNPLLSFDSLPLKLKALLEKIFPNIEFIEVSVEELEDFGPNLILIDSAKGIKKVQLISDIKLIEKTKTLSLHGFDLSLTLRLLLKAKKINSFKVIVIPINYPLKKALIETKKLIEKINASILFSENEKHNSCMDQKL